MEGFDPFENHEKVLGNDQPRINQFKWEDILEGPTVPAIEGSDSLNDASTDFSFELESLEKGMIDSEPAQVK